jgi:hypothetical protein
MAAGSQTWAHAYARTRKTANWPEGSLINQKYNGKPIILNCLNQQEQIILYINFCRLEWMT